ncbi:MAG: helix-turn-helix domain-containing protein [Candidatus Nanopelagicales bacterium]
MSGDDDGDACSPIESAMGVLGRAWAGAVLQAMLDGNQRFTDIRRAAPGVTDAVLSARLRELCQRGFAERVVDAGPPVAVNYHLTEVGRDTEPVLAALQEFGRRHRELLCRAP